MIRHLFFAITLLVAIGIRSSPAPAIPIVLDGDFSDSEQIVVATHDPVDATTSIVDFKEVRVTADDRYVYVQADFSRMINIQALTGGTVSLLLDEDNNTATGQTVKGVPGIDLVMEMGQGVAVRRYAVSSDKPSDIPLSETGFLFAPRVESARFEFRIDRTSSRNAAIKLIAEQNGSRRDETDQIQVALPPQVVPVAPGPDDRLPLTDPLARPDGTAFRVVIWNVAGLPATDRGRYLRMLAAVDADVVMLDEADPRRSPETIQGWLDSSMPTSGGWRVVIGQAFQGTMVAVRGQVTKAFDRLEHPKGSVESLVESFGPDTRPMLRAAISQSGIGTTGALATIGGRRILTLPIDLTSGCPYCDARRILETTSIAEAVRGALPRTKPDAVLIGGDFNLVGTREPVDVLFRAGLDVDGSALADVRALTLSGRSNATWRGRRGDRFTAGRLDWLLFSDSTLEQLGGFVFDTAEINPFWLKRHRLLKDDSESTSDHLPVVADFRWKR